MKSLKNQTIVIKLGTSTLTHGSKKLDRAHMLEIVRVVHKLVEPVSYTHQTLPTT